MAEPAGVLDESTGDYERVAPRKIRLEIGAISHRGLSRENNEDSYLAARLCPTLEIVTTSLTTVEGLRRSEGGGYLLIVADGMGGSRAVNGRVPSRSRRSRNSSATALTSNAAER